MVDTNKIIFSNISNSHYYFDDKTQTCCVIKYKYEAKNGGYCKDFNFMGNFSLFNASKINESIVIDKYDILANIDVVCGYSNTPCCSHLINGIEKCIKNFSNIQLETI